MHKFPIFNFKRFSELPLDELDKKRFAVYIIDFDWNYLFANKHAFEKHNATRDDLSGANLWKILREKMEGDPDFRTFLQRIEAGQAANTTTISAISRKRVSVTGYPLEDCYYFAVTILPDKESLMNELRTELSRNNGE